MLDGTRQGLKDTVVDFLKRDDIADNTLDDLIALTEADLNRKLRTRLMTAIQSTSITAQFETLDDQFAGVQVIWNALGDEMRSRSIGALIKLTGDNPGASGMVTDYAVVGGNLAFYPIPDPASPQVITMAGYKRLDGLADSDTNWVLVNHPDAYVYGCLAQSAPYYQDDERMPVWGSLYANAINAILMADAERYGERLSPQPSATQIV